MIGTNLHKNGACVFLSKDENNIAYCTIQKAYANGDCSLPKPISCHLYPIRIIQMDDDFVAVNYDQWEICSPACTLGEKNKIKIFEFAKAALIRRFGEEFYDQLAFIAKNMENDDIKEE